MTVQCFMHIIATLRWRFPEVLGNCIANWLLIIRIKSNSHVWREPWWHKNKCIKHTNLRGRGVPVHPPTWSFHLIVFFWFFNSKQIFSSRSYIIIKWFHLYFCRWYYQQKAHEVHVTCKHFCLFVSTITQILLNVLLLWTGVRLQGGPRKNTFVLRNRVLSTLS